MILYLLDIDARIVFANEGPSGVQVTTSDGRRFAGDILVGADGVHSFVRQEMWRLAKQEAPGYFSDNEIDRLLAPPPKPPPSCETCQQCY